MALFWKPGGSLGLAAQAAPVGAIDTSHDLGLVVGRSQGDLCLSINHGELQPGRELILIWVPVPGEPHTPEIGRGKITVKTVTPCDATNAQANDSYYRLEAAKLGNGRIYIAVAARPNALRIGNRAISARFVNEELSFRSCSSTEGLHFSAWSGTRTKQHPVWRRYYYLGYDVEPTCVERDFEEIKP